MHPSWELVGIVSAGSAALGAIATAGIISALQRRSNSNSQRRRRDSETPDAKRQKLSPPSPAAAADAAAENDDEGGALGQYEAPAAAAADLAAAAGAAVAAAATAAGPPHQAAGAAGAAADEADDAPGTPEAEASGAAPAAQMAHPDSVVDLQKLQELEQRVADLNALAELGKVYQDSLALSASLRNVSSFRLQQDKVLGRGSLAVVQEGEYAGDSVAVKLLPIGSVFAEDSRKEACLALCLHHPNVVRVVGVHLVEVEAKPYLALVQEAAPGGDLGWQIEDCDFHMGKRGEATLDVCLKLLLDAARGLAYMHDVDVVHGDVKSRNLLVFWERDEEDAAEGEGGGAADGEAAADQQQQQDAAGGAAGQSAAAAAAGAGGGDDDTAAAAAARGGSPEPPVWGLKWCDFGVSFRASEAPNGVLKTVTGTPGFRAPEVMDTGWGKPADTYAFGIIAWQLLTGEKPIVYDREWRMHNPNPNLLRVHPGAGPDAVPAALADLVWDCGGYRPEQRPSMREVAQRLEDIATARLEAERAAAAADAAAAAAAASEAAAAAAAAEAEQEAAAAASQAAQDAAAVAHQHHPAAAARLHTGGLARALSKQAREAAAGGAAADAAAAAAQQQVEQLLAQQQQQQHGGDALAASAPAGPSMLAAGGGRLQQQQQPGQQQQHHHLYEVLIENDDDPTTAEAVAHTLQAYEQRALHHSATAPVHSQLLDAAADAAAAAAAAAAAGGASVRGRLAAPQQHPTSQPISITGAVSRANIELRPAQGPGLLPPTPPSPAAGASAAAAAAAGGGGSSGGGSGGASGGGGGAASSAPAGGWYLASGSSFKRGLWLEKQSMPRASLSPRQSAGTEEAGGGGVPGSPLSLGAAVVAPDSLAVDSGAPQQHSSFSISLRRESQLPALPSVAETHADELHGAWQAGAAAAAGGSPAEAGGQGGGGGGMTAAAADAAAARALRRSQTTRRLGTDVLAAAGALSKALSAFSAAGQAMPALAGGTGAGSSVGTAAAGGWTAGSSSNVLLSQDFVAAARSLSEALAALLPSAAALADADPRQGAAAAAAASDAVQGLRTLQGRIAAARGRGGESGPAPASAPISIAGPAPRRSSADGFAAAGAAGEGGGSPWGSQEPMVVRMPSSRRHSLGDPGGA